MKTRPSRPSWALSGQLPRGLPNWGSSANRTQQAFGIEAADADAADQQGAVAAAGRPGIPHVVQAQRLFGDPDYLLRIVTTDLAAYQRLQDERLSALPGVQRMTSTLVMKRIVQDRPLPA